MKIIFVGTGSAFTLNNYQTNTVISRNGKNLLIDAGGDIRHSLKFSGMSYKDIDAIYITHLHSDHLGGLESLAFCSYFDPKCEKPTLIGNSELIREAWNSSLKGGLKSIQGKKTSLEDYFDVQMIKKNGKFFWEDIEFRIVQSVHIMDEYSIVPSYGLMITDPDSNKKIYYTGDTQFCPAQISCFYDQADLIIHDCETTPYKSGVHANYLDLITLPENTKKKMILQHYQDNVIDPNQEDNWKASAKGAPFTCWDGENYGFIKKGFVFDTSDLK
jgi:ribonuclease BN (tRNA processing enzyme)